MLPCRVWCCWPLMLPGCALLGGGTPELDTYELSAPTPDSRRRHSGIQVLIAEPTALKALDGQNIVIKPAPGVIQYLKGAQWADRLPEVVQARLAETFQKSGRFGGVGKPGEGLAIDYQVIVDIRAFEVRVSRGRTAYIERSSVLSDRLGETFQKPRAASSGVGMPGEGLASRLSGDRRRSARSRSCGSGSKGRHRAVREGAQRPQRRGQGLADLRGQRPRQRQRQRRLCPRPRCGVRRGGGRDRWNGRPR